MASWIKYLFLQLRGLVRGKSRSHDMIQYHKPADEGRGTLVCNLIHLTPVILAINSENLYLFRAVGCYVEAGR